VIAIWEELTAVSAARSSRFVIMSFAALGRTAIEFGTVNRWLPRSGGRRRSSSSETGLTPAVADVRAMLAYAAYLGHAQLAHTTPAALPRTSRARKELIEELAAVLLG